MAMGYRSLRILNPVGQAGMFNMLGESGYGIFADSAIDSITLYNSSPSLRLYLILTYISTFSPPTSILHSPPTPS